MVCMRYLGYRGMSSILTSSPKWAAAVPPSRNGFDSQHGSVRLRLVRVAKLGIGYGG